MTTSALKSSPGAMRAWVIVAVAIWPSAPIWAEPRIIGAPRSMRDIAERGALRRRLDDERRLARLSRRLRYAGHRIVDSGRRRSISTSAFVRLSGALSLTGSVPVSHEPKLMSRLARAAASSANVTVAEPSSPAERLTSIWVGRRGPCRRRRSSAIRGRPRTRPSRLRASLGRGTCRSEVRRALRWRGTACPRDGPSSELEIEGQIAFRLPLTVDGSSLRPASRRRGSRIREIGERVSGSGHVRVRGRVDDRAWRGVGDVEGEVARLHPPGRRQGHGSAVAGEREFMTGERSGPLVGHHDRQAGHEARRRRRGW